MKTTVRRAAGKLADAVREMNEAQRLMLVLRTATGPVRRNPGAAPDTYDEFLARHVRGAAARAFGPPKEPRDGPAVTRPGRVRRRPARRR